MGGLPSLSWYILTGKDEGIAALLDLPEVDVNQPGSKYYSLPLIFAAQMGNVGAILIYGYSTWKRIKKVLLMVYMLH